MRPEISAHKYGAKLWRNNSGALLDTRGVPVRFGLGNVSARLNAVYKSSDYIGITREGMFVACEMKPPGWRYTGNAHERAQLAFINDVIAHGGRGGFVTCEDDLIKLLI
ncbi:MAG: hypothetical protein WC322_01375 [Candidatus Paceibacterota bacterium]|jgi:hypothetical protein